MALSLFIALRQLWDRKLLNGIAIGGVALGVLVLIGMNGIMQGFQMKFKGEILKISPHIVVFDKELGQKDTLLGDYVRNVMKTPPETPFVGEVAHIQPNDRVTQIKRPYAWIEAIESIPEVEVACAGLVGQAVISLGTQELGVDMRGVVPEEQEHCTPIRGYIKQGTWEQLGSISNGIALGSGVAEKIGAQVGDQIHISSSKSAPQSLQVVAIFEADLPPVDKTRVYVNIITAQRILHRANVIGRLEIRLRDAFVSKSLAKRLKRIMNYDNESWEETNANFLDLFDLQNRIVAMVIGAILIVGGFGILAIQIMIVLQKTKDIAILRSVGLRRRDILSIFLIQGIVVAIIGATLGDLLGWRLVEFLGALKVKQDGLVKSNTFLVYKDSMFYVYGFVFALVVGISASLLPAWQGSRVEPVDVLRGQV